VSKQHVNIINQTSTGYDACLTSTLIDRLKVSVASFIHLMDLHIICQVHLWGLMTLY